MRLDGNHSPFMRDCWATYYAGGKPASARCGCGAASWASIQLFPPLPASVLVLRRHSLPSLDVRRSLLSRDAARTPLPLQALPNGYPLPPVLLLHCSTPRAHAGHFQATPLWEFTSTLVHLRLKQWRYSAALRLRGIAFTLLTFSRTLRRRAAHDHIRRLRVSGHAHFWICVGAGIATRHF